MQKTEIRNSKAARIDGMIVELWFLAVITGLVMALAWHVLPSSKPAAPEQPAISHSEISAMIASINADMTRQVSSVQTPQATEGGSYHYLGFKLDNYDFATQVRASAYTAYELKKSADSADQNSKLLKPARELIQDTLTQNGFAVVVDAHPKIATIDHGSLYQRDDSVCTITEGYDSVIVACADKQDFAKAAGAIQPFVAAYRAGKGYEDDYTAFGLLETGIGKTKNDPYAILYTTGNAAYFYQKKGAWVYYKSGKEGLACPDSVKEPLAAAAFAGLCSKPGDPY